MCVAEYPHLKQISDRYRGKGLEVISVGIGEPTGAAGRLAESVGATFSVIPDPDRAIAEAYHIDGTPENVIIGRSGKIEQTVDGYGPQILDQAIEKVMGGSS